MHIVIKRTTNEDKQTLGTLQVQGFKCYTLELPWKQNKKGISCIPPGKYKVVKRFSEKYGNHLHILDVKGRSFILIHNGNYHTQIQGCILVGDSLTDINKDGYKDVTNSTKTLEKLVNMLPSTGITLEIKYELIVT